MVKWIRREEKKRKDYDSWRVKVSEEEDLTEEEREKEKDRIFNFTLYLYGVSVVKQVETRVGHAWKETENEGKVLFW